MNAFTFRDYIRCIHTLKMNAVFKLADKSQKYYLNVETEEDKQEIINILKDTEEMVEFINNFLDLKEKIKEEDLELFYDKYSIRRHNIKRDKLIYRVKDKEYFFVIDEVCKLDNIELYDVLNYCINFMQGWNIKNKIKNGKISPVIIPIIIYTGVEKIKTKKVNNIENSNKYILKRFQTYLDYNLIDINKISVSALEKINTKFSKEMLSIKSNNDNNK